MAKVCQVTGKRPRRGFKYVTRGIPKKKKGIGVKVTGKTKCRFIPNLIKKRFWLPEEKRWITLKVSAAGMRTIEKRGLGKVVNDLRSEGVKI